MIRARSADGELKVVYFQCYPASRSQEPKPEPVGPLCAAPPHHQEAFVFDRVKERVDAIKYPFQ
nr:hypothetical protein [Desulfotruncus arcticus]